MESASNALCKKITRHWKRRGYERLNASTNSSRRRRTNQVALASTVGKRRRFWKIKTRPKLSFYKLVKTPKRFLFWLRDAYMNMMMGLANSTMVANACGGVAGDGLGGYGSGPYKEYDQRLIVEIYKVLLKAQNQVVGNDVGKLGNSVVGTKLGVIVE